MGTFALDGRRRLFGWAPQRAQGVVWDPEGARVGALGGPLYEEGSTIPAAIIVGPGDTIHVFERSGLTHARFSPELEFLDATPLPGQPHFNGVVRMPAASPAVAEIVVSPLRVPVTTPAESTTATSVSPLDQATVAPATTRPTWSRTSAASSTVWPKAVNRTVSGDTATVVGTVFDTMSSARPVTPNADAVTATAPSATPVTKPNSYTRATSVSLDSHENSAAATVWLFASAAVAANRSVSPSTTVAVSGDTFTALTTWATVTAALPETPPALAVIVAVPLFAAVTSPDASTGATRVSLDDQENSAAATSLPLASVASASRRTVPRVLPLCPPLATPSLRSPPAPPSPLPCPRPIPPSP